MKLALALIGAVLAQGCIAQNFTEPTPSPWFQCPSSEGFFPNPYNCSSYFHCTNGLPWTETCSAGLYFNPVTLRCDWPQNVQCSPLITTQAPADLPTDLPQPKNKGRSFVCPQSGGVYPHADCSKYYSCGNGIAYEMSCPPGQLFDIVVSSCNHGYLTDCGDRLRPDDSSNPTTGFPTTTTRRPAGNTTYDCPRPDGVFPHQECNKYYTCAGNVPYVMHCRDNLLFDLVYNGCNYPEYTDCGDRIRPDGPTPSTTVKPSGGNTTYDCPIPDGVFPHQECNKYYTCSGNVPYVMHCRDNLLFDLVYNGCNYPEYTDCGDRIRPDVGPSTTTVKPSGGNTTYDCPRPDGVFPHEECNKYYTCSGNVPYVMHCRDNLLFDLVYNGCNYPEYTDCGDRIRPDGSPTTSTRKPTTPSGDQFVCPGNGLFADPKDCSAYYNCADGYAWHMSCGAGFYFHPTGLYCDWAANVPCSVQKTQSKTKFVGVRNLKARINRRQLRDIDLGVDGDFDCPDNGVFPHPECDKYYNCWEGVANLFQCGDEQLFDLVYNGCNYPDLTDCGNRTRPDGAETTTRRTTVSEGTTAGQGFTCPEPDGFFPVSPLQCSSDYYICVSNEAFLSSCPPGALFDPVDLVCSPTPQHCQSTGPVTEGPTPTTWTVEPTTTPGAFECPDADGYYPDPSDCESYYVCSNGNPILESCPDGLVFNPASGLCDWPSSVPGCSRKQKVVRSTEGFYVGRIDWNCTNEGVFPFDECDKYVTCHLNVARLFQCYDGYLFDPTFNGCSPANETDCGNRTLPVQSTTSTPIILTTEASTSGTGFVCPSSDGFFPIPGACTADYYVCVGGEVYNSTCPGNALFDPVTRVCTKPQNTSCFIVTTTTEAPFSCPTEDGFYPLRPGTCSQDYYTCVEQIAYVTSCPSGSLFHPVLRRCVSSPSCLSTTTTPDRNSTSTTTPGYDTTSTATVATTEVVNTTVVVSTEKPTDDTTVTEAVSTTEDTTTTTEAATTTTEAATTITETTTTTTESTTTTTTAVPTTTIATTTTEPATTTTTEQPTTVTSTTTRPTTTTESVTNTTTAPRTTTRATTTTAASTAATTVGPFRCPQPEGLFPDPASCNSYYVCDHGQPILATCSEGLYFNPTISICDWPYNVPQCKPSLEKGIYVRTDDIYVGEIDWDCPSGGVFEHWECDKYITCYSGIARLFQCQDGYLFDTTFNGCNEAALTDCGNRTLPTDNICSTPDGFFPVPGACSADYYVCVDGTASLASCPQGSIFDPDRLICANPANVACAQTTTTSTTEVTTEGPFVCPEPDGFFAMDPDSCSRTYYTCVDGTPFESVCPGTSLFDPDLLRCVSASSCGGGNTTTVATTTTTTSRTTTPSTTTPSTTTPSTTTTPTTTTIRTTTTTPATSTPQGFICPEADGFFPVRPNECNHEYYTCTGGDAFLSLCPGDTVFDPVLLRCVVPASCLSPNNNTTTSSASTVFTSPVPNTTVVTTVTTRNATTVRTTTPATTTTTTGSQFQCPPDDGYYPDPTTCQNYYVCSNGNAILSSCPPGLVFDPDAGICDWPFNVPGCSTEDNVETEETRIVDFECPSSDGFFPVPGECSENYYVCVDGVANEAVCPSGSIFDPDKLVCANPINVACAQTTVFTTTEASFTCPSPDGFFPLDSESCSKTYYTCIDGTPYLSECPGTSVFDPFLLRCVSPSTCTVIDSSTAASTTVTEGPFECPEPDGFFPLSPTECVQEYYTCAGDIPYLSSCPAGTLFDPVLLRCVRAASCGGQSNTTTTTTAATTSVVFSTTEASNTSETVVVSTTPAALTTTDPTTGQPFECPAVDGSYPDPSSCENYYVCSNGVPILVSCPPGLYFNPDTELCDWPFNVPDCTLTNELSAAAEKLKNKRGWGDVDLGVVQYDCPDDGVFPHSECNKYYECWNSVAHLFQCRQDLLFDLVYDGCNYKELTDCGDRTRPDNATTTTTVSPTVDFHCPEPDGFFAIPGECSADYYVCVNGAPTVSSCPAGTIFDPDRLLCASPDSVPCVASTTTVATTTAASFSCPEPDGFFPLTSCSCSQSYYTCVEGTAYISECPGTSVFDPTTLRCVPANDCSMQDNSTTTTSATTTTQHSNSTTTAATTQRTTTTTTTGGQFVCPPTDGYYPDPESCANYYVCVNGQAIIMSCSPGLVFNPSTGSCDWPFNVPGCSQAKQAQDSGNNQRGWGDVDLGVVEYDCPRDGVFQHPECNKYYECWNSVAHLFQCRDDLLFDLVYSGCNYKELTECGNRTRPDDGATTTTARPTTVDFHCPEPDGFFPIPGECSADYYVCVNGAPFVYSCPPGSVFDPDRLVCDTPDAVPCAQTTTSATTTAEPFECPEPDGFFPIQPDVCYHEYYICVADEPYLSSCPGETLFDPETLRCVTPDDCSGAVFSTTTTTAPPSNSTTTTAAPSNSTTTTTAPGEPFECPPEDGSYPHPDLCEVYYVCVNGQAILTDCPPGLYFNPATNLCDWPYNVPSCEQ